MNAEELPDDADTVKFVGEAAWLRYNDLLGLFPIHSIVLQHSYHWHFLSLSVSFVQTSADCRHETEL
jgi:hypothetical protein